MLVAACTSEADPTATSSSSGVSPTATTEQVSDAPGAGGTSVGFLFVGPRDDFGYNQAAYLGSEAVKNSSSLDVIQVENVPETQEAERVMEQMIQNGAKIIFPTSYGHLDPALEVAARHPDVVFVHQGGLKTSENLGTYFGNIWEGVYLSGVAAGHMTETKKLGYIVSFPIPQVLMNINAFTLGARSVDPDITTTVIFTANWCDPGKQAEAANTLITAGVDVLTQHQDCTKTIVEAAERNDIMSVGYHADASELAPNGWITGAVWDWGGLYNAMVNEIDAGNWVGSEYAGQFRIGLSEGAVVLAPFGASVPESVRSLVLAEKDRLINEAGYNPFEGPILDNNGAVQIADGVKPDTQMLETTGYLIEGVIGTIPQ